MALSGILKDTFIYGFTDATGKLVAFLTFPMIAAALMPSDFGVLELAMSVVGLFSIIIGCGMSNGVQRFYWDNRDRVADGSVIISSGFFIQIILGIMFLAVTGSLIVLLMIKTSILSKYFNNTAILALVILTPAAQWLQFIQDTSRLLFLKWQFVCISLFVKIFAATLSVAAVVALHWGIDGYIIVRTFVVISAVPIGLLLIKDNLTIHIQKKCCYDLLRFGYPFIFVMIAYWLFGSIDRWMIASMSSVSETGIYSIAYRFSSVVLFVSGAFGLAWSPHSMKIIMRNRLLYPEVCGAVLVCLVFGMTIVGGGISLFSGEIIGTIMPENYYPATLPLSILCFGVIFQSTTQVTAVGISLSKKTHIFAHLAWIAALVNFIGNWFLIPKYGATGAAISTALSYFFLAVAYGFYTQKLDPIKIYWKPTIWLAFLGFCLAYVSLNYSSLDWGWLTFQKILFAIVLLIAGSFAIPQNEIRMIAARLRQEDI